jgi:hypothetical protein
VIRGEPEEDTERLYYEEGREKQTGFEYPQFVFRRYGKDPNEKSILEGWSGIMRAGNERVHLNINYSYLLRVNIQEAAPTPGK